MFWLKTPLAEHTSTVQIGLLENTHSPQTLLPFAAAASQVLRQIGIQEEEEHKHRGQLTGPCRAMLLLGHLEAVCGERRPRQVASAVKCELHALLAACVASDVRGELRVLQVHLR